MNEYDFRQLVGQNVKAIYPKAKLKPATALTEDELLQPGRFDDVNNYHNFIKTGITALYMAVPAGYADVLLEKLQETAGNQYLIYTSRTKHYDKDPKDSFRIVFLNSTEPLDGIRREGSFSEESGLSNEAIITHFAALLLKYPLRFEDISSNTIGGTIQGQLTNADAKNLATAMFEYNTETANFIAGEDVNEEELDYNTNKAYFVDKLVKHLYGEKTFYYKWNY